MRLITLFAAALLSACGFHLAGSGAAVPALRGVAVIYQQPYRVGPPPLVDALKKRLDGPSQKPTGRLVIREIEDIRRVLAISPTDGNAIAFEMVSTVVFDFSRPGGSSLHGQTLSVRRAYSFDATQRLAAETERRELLAAMHQELADMIVLRLQTALQQ